MRGILRILLPSLLVAALAGCGYNFVGRPPGSNNQAPGFTLSVSPNSLTVVQGGSGTTTLTVTPQGGFSGTVNLSLQGAPNGVTLSPTSVTVSGSGPVTQTLTLSVASSVAPGTYTLQVVGTSGNITASTSLTLTVTPTGPTGSFSVSVQPTSVTIVKVLGIFQPATATVSLQCSGGYNSPVALTAQVKNPLGLLASELNVSFERGVLACGEATQVTIEPSGLTLLYSRYTVEIRALSPDNRESSTTLTVNVVGL